MGNRRVGVMLALLWIGWLSSSAWADPSNVVKLAWLGAPPAADRETAFIDGPAPKDAGLAGLKLAIADNNTSGKFINQSFTLDIQTLSADGDAVAALSKMAAAGIRFVATDMPAPQLVKVAGDPKLAGLTIFNTAAADDSLRGADCRKNLLHTLPSRAMMTDALTQVLIKKDWRKWLLIVGPDANDELYAAALRRSARKFGAKLVAERKWTFTRDSRHTAEGEIIDLTQGADYDVVVVADEAGNFGDDVVFNTWKPRPVAGTQGIVAAGWHPAYARWGSEQLQNRFKAQSGRTMTDVDFAAWEAGRAVGEAAMRARSTDPEKIKTTMHGDDFAMAAFKGRTLNFRAWDGQLRQPMLVAWARSVVAVAPEEGFIHPVTDLDTLGVDKGESTCVLQ